MTFTMNKIKLLSIAVIGLLLLNLGILGFLYLRQQRHARPHDGRPQREPREVVIERLNLDKDQIAKYDALIKVHRQQRAAANEKIHTMKSALFASVPDGSTVARDSILTLLIAEERQLELVHYNHFTDIKKLCKPDQQRAFEDLSKDMLDIFSGMKPK
jgi:periplasmic protein CpxP/Spy